MNVVDLNARRAPTDTGDRKQDADLYRLDALRHARQRVIALEAEERKLYRLLALALRVATADGREADPLITLDLLCALDGCDPARPAWVEEKERREAIAADLEQGQRFLQTLAEMNA